MTRSILKPIAYHEPKSPATEAYRTLRTNIQYAAVDRPLQSLLITSAGPGEGKSLTAANLAIVMAHGGKKTLLVDCDLRKPMQQRLFGLSNLTGLTSLLVQGGDPAGVTKETMVPQLGLITSGLIPPNPAELLGSQAIRPLIEELKNRHEFVIFDGPPLIAVTDAALLAPWVDGVLLVIEAGKTRIDMVQEARSIIQNAGARLIGCVLNGVRRKTKDYHYYYYYAEKSGTDD
ncbi:MAG: CpsD/CapB family tyrosine-protein kinase [Syntrophomonadaceae bacterium]|jgi:capsular exopolysaccharide synthesis family protein|nr:CpsD/CapB family tyrosine-protein kinase [Syntrophomonadaceae bacterium]